MNLLPAEIFDFLRRTDAPTVSNAIETFNVRMRNEGFVHGRIHCMFPEMPPVAGYAVTARIRTGAPPISGLCYYHRHDFWKYVASVPAPKIGVVRDMDRIPGNGAFIGEIHAQIGKAFGCVGWLTNGAIRDVKQVQSAGLQCFAETTTVSHAYAHIVEFGEPIEIDGVKINSGDLLHGDLNGIQLVPAEIASQLPEAVKQVQDREAELIRFCQSPDFTIEKLEQFLGKAPPSSQTVEIR